MVVKSMENRVYSIIIICLLILIALLIWETDRPGHYQISGAGDAICLLNTKTSEIYIWAGAGWVYIGKPRKTNVLVDLESLSIEAEMRKRWEAAGFSNEEIDQYIKKQKQSKE